MTGAIVNLRRERKRRARSAAADAAEASRLVHGLSKVEKAVLRTERDAAARHLDGHIRQPAPDAPPPPRS